MTHKNTVFWKAASFQGPFITLAGLKPELSIEKKRNQMCMCACNLAVHRIQVELNVYTMQTHVSDCIAK